MIQITYKEFFELSKTKPKLQKIFNQCFMSAIRIASCAKKIFPNELAPDVGELSLNGLEALAQTEGIVLTDRKEINAEYMSKILNSYGKKDLE